MKTSLEKAGHTLLYLPPYSPDLNPIEKKWAQAKKIEDSELLVLHSAENKQELGLYAHQQVNQVKLRYLTSKKQVIESLRQKLSDEVNLVVALGGPTYHQENKSNAEVVNGN